MFISISVYSEGLEFDKCEKIEHCFDLSIGDEKVENLERLDIVLKSTEYRKNIQLKNATLEIMDDDGTLCIPYVYTAVSIDVENSVDLLTVWCVLYLKNLFFCSNRAK